jgi:hypothetical protein
MDRVKNRLLYAVFSMSAGLAGITLLSRCSGSCSACFGCAAPGAGIVLLWAVSKRRKKENGMA